jgi:hypothetical protein
MRLEWQHSQALPKTAKGTRADPGDRAQGARVCGDGMGRPLFNESCAVRQVYLPNLGNGAGAK